jgi:adenylate kinase family enzyme
MPLLNGSINSGKSTVAQLLTKKIPNVALVEIDVLRNMIEWMTIDKAVPINLENAISVIRTFTRNNLNVLVPYPLSEENQKHIVSSLKDIGTKIYFFTLAPRLEKALTDRGSRKLDDWERDRIKYHYEIGINRPSFGEIIDNSEQTPEETANSILSRINYT